MRPTIFLGSSRESLRVLAHLKKGLDEIATVVPWTDPSLQSPGGYFLDSLIEAPAQFDFAVLVFGKDDVVVSRSRRQPIPRDNVIFELGLFMSALGRDRTFVLAPRVWKSKLKVLSDISGLNLVEYDPPNRQRDLPAAISTAVDALRNRVLALDIRPHVRGPISVGMLWGGIEAFLTNRSEAPHRVDNIALDMEATWAFLRDHLVAGERRHVHWRALFIDGGSRSIGALSSASVSVQMARSREKEIRRTCERAAAELRRRGVHLEFRAYSEVPVIHGLLLNRKMLFLSVCGIRKGRLVGAPNPYLYAERPIIPARDLAATHLVESFGGWFEHRWKRARPVWPTGA